MARKRDKGVYSDVEEVKGGRTGSSSKGQHAWETSNREKAKGDGVDDLTVRAETDGAKAGMI